jgi:hypothetical protein
VTGSVPGFGGQGYVTQESRALSSISESPAPDLSQGQQQQIDMLQRHDSQIRFLAKQVKQAQQGVNEATQNPIQQIQSFIADIIVLFGGGELASGALDFGDLQYILPAIGALFGFGDGPFPISLFEAAEKFFLGYVVPQQQFVDVINHIIEAWLGVLGIDKKFIKDIEALITAFGDLFQGVENLFPSLNELFGALGVNGGNLGPLGQLLSPIIHLFTGLDISNFGNMIEFITNAIDPFINGLTAIINWVDSILAIFGWHGAGGVVNNPLGDTTNPFYNLFQFLGEINFASPTFNPLHAAQTFITTILNPTGLLTTLGDIGNAIQQAFQQFVDALVAFVGPIPIIGDVIRTLANFLGLTHTQAATAQSAAESATTTQSEQTIAKPGWNAMDATADAVFPIAQLNGSTSSTINVTATASAIGFITTPDNGKKSCIIWLGQDTTGLTAFYVNLYQLNVTTGVATLLEASPNVLSSVSNPLAWNYYDLVTPITSQVGYVYAAEIVVVGSGTYKIAGIPSDWKPANPTVYPQQLGSSRTAALPTAPATFSPTYSGVVPWFGLGGFAFAGPLTSPFLVNGTYTYTIPNWLKYGDKIDVAGLGGAGGGESSAFFATGQGAVAAQWVTQTLIYGIDIPTSTTTLTVTVGSGGSGGSGVAVPGGDGGDSTVTGTGVATITAPGGPGAISGPQTVGKGPGSKTFNGVTYPGGGNVGTGAPGAAPGGGGGGGGAYGAGGHGADGAVWIAAYQAGTNP